jgi:hypothetical protein
LFALTCDERVQQLDCNVTFEIPVMRAPNDAHPALADLFDQRVTAGKHGKTVAPYFAPAIGLSRQGPSPLVAQLYR